MDIYPHSRFPLDCTPHFLSCPPVTPHAPKPPIQKCTHSLPRTAPLRKILLCCPELSAAPLQQTLSRYLSAFSPSLSRSSSPTPSFAQLPCHVRMRPLCPPPVSRFKFPRHVKRKVLRIAEAWRFFQVLNEGPTQTSLSLERFLEYHLRNGSSQETISKLREAFLTLDVNNNGGLTFEEFLLGFSLLQEAAAAQPFARTSASTGVTSSTDPGVIPDDGALSTTAPTAGIDCLATFPANGQSVAAAPTPISITATVAAVAPTATALPDPATQSEVPAGAGNDRSVRGFTSWLWF
ncbi:hypothetical protein Vafri_1738 [Volvox africanus]|nr:hypothetical protein Vafri_1738 [Volvox africanus]